MNIKDVEVIACLSKAKEMGEHYELYARSKGHTKRSVDELHEICCDYLNKQITVFDLNLAAEGSVIKGMFAAMADGTYEIYLLAELSDRERRFVWCKELFHVILDNDDCRNMDLVAHVEEAASAFTIADSDPTSPVVMEAMAEIAAVEFLFPYAERQQIVNASGGNPDFAAIARQYGIPQHIVELYLSDHLMAELGKITW